MFIPKAAALLLCHVTWNHPCCIMRRYSNRMAGSPAGLTGCDRQHLAKIFTYLTQILAISSNQGAWSQMRLTDGCEFTEEQHPVGIWKFLVPYLVFVLLMALLCPAPLSQHFFPAVSSETGWLSFILTWLVTFTWGINHILGTEVLSTDSWWNCCKQFLYEVNCELHEKVFGLCIYV